MISCILARLRELRTGGSSGKVVSAMDAIVIDNVQKRFGTVEAVRGLSARVPAGSIYGFLGPNGAGKTTTIRMIMNIISPDEGRIEILGRSSLLRRGNRIGYMPEERGLYRKMKVRSMLAYIGAIKGMTGREARAATDRWLGEIGLSAWAGRKVEDLSRGMQQKVQFAATVINDPDVLILDEPFSGLDPVNLDHVKGIMLRLHQSGKTIIFSTHMMEHAERLCDQILLIHRGEKLIDGPTQEVRASHQTDAVSLELESDDRFVDALPMVAEVIRNGRRMDVLLRDGSDSQELLAALVGRVRVRAFEQKIPSLHEIFVHMVGGADA